MDLLLALLHAAFFAPVLVRAARASGGPPSGESRGRLARSALAPVLVVHATGGLLLEGGVVLALVTGRVARLPTWPSYVGAATILAAVVLMTWSILVLRSWRLLPKIDAGHELCTTGPYALVRHPIYLALDLLALGSVVWLPTTPVVVGAALLVVGGDLRGRIEERVLVASFGDRYREYMQRVRRTIPGVY